MIARAAHTDTWIWRVNQNQNFFFLLSFMDSDYRIVFPERGWFGLSAL